MEDGVRSLEGVWSLSSRPHGSRRVRVPGCWEEEGLPKDFAGPVLYQTEFTVPESWRGFRLFLEFDAVSYACTVRVNGEEVGHHIGAWDRFGFEVSAACRVGVNRLELEVEKPASPTAGPGSPCVPGRYPLRETLSGFLPYVWGHLHGGIWQGVRLRRAAAALPERFSVRGDASGGYTLEARFPEGVRGHFRLRSPEGRLLEAAPFEGEQVLWQGQVEDPLRWSPDRPELYTLELELPGVTLTRRFGFRTVRAEGPTLTLNGQPIYPRMALSWGWYPQRLCPDPGPEAVREEFARMRSLGYNGVKLCLWHPPDYYFDLADEEGMLLWLELPLWLPRLTPFARRQIPLEYERLLWQVRHHPSLILYSLGCELNREADAEFLGGLYGLAKPLVGDALLRDNSGSGEAYGGLLDEHAEYYDHHFYAELPFFRPLLEYFSPRWRKRQPWLLGEFCDSDSFRDLKRLKEAWGGMPWWAVDDPALNPQGARWQYDVQQQEARLKGSGFEGRGAELERISCHQSLLHRKHTLETVRLYRELSGYVVTGLADTPISTAGMWDDTGRLKFDPEAFRAFNADSVVLVGWDRRRVWEAGGDRAAYWEPHACRSGGRVRAHAVVSHYGEAARLPVAWEVRLADGSVWAAGWLERPEPFRPGELAGVGVAEFEAPAVGHPQQLTLGFQTPLSHNAWPIWVYPEHPFAGLKLALIDPGGLLEGLEALVEVVPLEAAPVAVATRLTPELKGWLEAGGRAVLYSTRDRDSWLFPAERCPFWREAVKVLEAHPAWGDFPHTGFANLQFYGLATDLALCTPTQEVAPILRRLDARTFVLHDYAAEASLGQGRLIVTTLRLSGGLGEQPLGIARHLSGQQLLAEFCRYLTSG
jgi:hypothetical protein